MDCLDPNVAVDWARGCLSAEERGRWDAHMDVCSTCRALVAAALSDSQASGPRRRDAALPKGTEVLRYLIIERVGAGAMGEVYAAYDPKLDRKVALKLVRPQSGAAAPLQREAQAAAQVRHAHVVSVYDVGEWNGETVLALEYVPGGTLRDWLGRKSRGWREIAECFAGAARGLEAVHRSGLVHRDFKPDNVLVGEDDVARVTDFGLARAPTLAAAPNEATGTRSLATTTHGAAGTPAYMAPELHSGKAADARSDQFSFCVSLYEALYGERPFQGQTLSELQTALQSTTNLPKSGPRGAVPRWLGRVVLRGLAVDPSQRHASMDALARALERSSRSSASQRLLTAAAVVTALALVLFGAAWLQQRSQLCSGGKEAMASVWNQQTREGLKKGFLSLSLPFGEDTWARVEKRLDAYSEGWAAMHREACEATRVRRVQAEEMLTRRMACLSKGERELTALVHVLGAPTPRVVEKSVEATEHLPKLNDCADVALLDPTEPPVDPAQRAAFEAVQQKLAKAKALQNTGDYVPGLALAKELVPEAEKTGSALLRAEAQFRLGELQGLSGDSAAAVVTLQELAYYADAHKLDSLGLWAWTKLVMEEGMYLQKHESVPLYFRMAQVDLERLGRPKDREAKLLYTYGGALAAEGKYEEALAKSREALALLQASANADVLDIKAAHNNIGSACGNMGNAECAVEELGRAYEINVKELGARHPLVAMSLNNLSLAYTVKGDREKAFELAKRGLALSEEVLGKDHPRALRAHETLAEALRGMGRFEEALQHRIVTAAGTYKRYGEEGLPAADMHEFLGEAYLEAGHPADAQREIALAQALHAKLTPKGHFEDVKLLNLLGRAMRAQGHSREGLDAHKRALSLAEKTLQPTHAYLIQALTGVGEALLELGRPLLAQAPLERALKLREERKSLPEERADVELALGRALWLSGTDRTRARSLLADADQHVAAAFRTQDYETWHRRTSPRKEAKR